MTPKLSKEQAFSLSKEQAFSSKSLKILKDIIFMSAQFLLIDS